MKFFKKKLSNGIIVIMEKRELPVVSLSITNKFGAAFENSDIKGISHVIEHMLFTGTKTRTHEDISREIEKKGGILNAFTSHDVTSYWFKLPSEHVFAGLDILIDMLNNAIFDERKFEKEKKVILEEIKLYHDAPDRSVYRIIEENLYKEPFGKGVIGSIETVSALKRDYVHDYFRENYSPENYIVTIVGNADFDRICEYLERSFKKKEIRSKVIAPVKRNAESVEEREGIDQAHFIFAIHSPFANTDDYYAFEVLDAYLANGMSSRLFLKIREERGLAYSVISSISAENNYSYYTVYVGTRKEAVDEVKKIILEEIDNVKNMSEKDLKEAQERLIGLKKLSSEESSNVMFELMFSEIIGRAEDYYEHEKKIRKVKLEDVKRVAKLKSYSTAAIVPK